MMYVLALMSSNPLRLFTANRAAQDDGGKRLHLLQQNIFRHVNTNFWGADTFDICPYTFLCPCSRFPPLHLLHLFFCHYIWVSRLPLSSPALFSSRRLDLSFSCFLLSILTRDWCALLRRCLPLKNWQPTLLGTDITFRHICSGSRGPFLLIQHMRKWQTSSLIFFLLSQNCGDIWLAPLDKKVWGEVLHMTHRCELRDILDTPRYVNINEVFC